MYLADICPPGTYRSIEEFDTLPCKACPQGRWSKNWELRERGECLMCPTGTSCPVDGMTTPCTRADLPTPFVPVINENGQVMEQHICGVGCMQSSATKFGDGWAN